MTVKKSGIGVGEWEWGWGFISKGNTTLLLALGP